MSLEGIPLFATFVVVAVSSILLGFYIGKRSSHQQKHNRNNGEGSSQKRPPKQPKKDPQTEAADHAEWEPEENLPPPAEKSEKPASFRDDYKMTLVVNSSLKMGKGKTSAQCCHACLGAFRRAERMRPDVVRAWSRIGQAKVVLKAESTQELEDLEQVCKALNIPCCLVQDAGRTQIAPGSITVIAVGPGTVEEINEVTGTLKLLS